MSVLALLTCCDSTLTNTVPQALFVRPIDGLTLEVADHLLDSVEILSGGEVAIWLVLADPEAIGATADVIRQLVKQSQTPVIVLGEDNPQSAFTFMQSGAKDYLPQPINGKHLRFLVDDQTVAARQGVGPGAAESVHSVGDLDPFLYVAGREMGRLMEQVRRVAPQQTTVLLGGETGTGKTRLARLIHELSPRRDESFLTINCGSLSANLIESEMFGHVRGAFTGADRERRGKFAEVGKGTLLLDDIDALPLELQAKLLRAVDERVFEAVGSNESQPLRARLIAASNRPLDAEVAAGRFRSDLYYRLNVVGFQLPPLRERPEMVPPLARKFIAELAAASGLPVNGMTREVVAVLRAYSWPGNVREVRNAMERAVALCASTTITLDDLPDAVRESAAAGLMPRLRITSLAAPLTRSKEEAEKTCIAEALLRHSNNRLRAAAELGISRMTLYKKLRKYGFMATA